MYMQTECRRVTYHAQAIILVVDSTDRERVGTVRAELTQMMQHDFLRSAVVMVLANKQDLRGAMTTAELSDALALHALKDHVWHIQPSCALTGEGLQEALEWLATNVRNARRR